MQDEAVVLRFLHFQIAVDHPYRYLFNFCASLGAGPRLVRLAACAVNDCLLRTDVCAATAPEIVAAGAQTLLDWNKSSYWINTKTPDHTQLPDTSALMVMAVCAVMVTGRGELAYSKLRQVCFHDEWLASPCCAG